MTNSQQINCVAVYPLYRAFCCKGSLILNVLCTSVKCNTFRLVFVMHAYIIRKYELHKVMGFCIQIP